jgi:hypothetical protein
VRKNAIIAQKSIAGAVENSAPSFGFDLLDENGDLNGAHLPPKRFGLEGLDTRGCVSSFKIKIRVACKARGRPFIVELFACTQPPFGTGNNLFAIYAKQDGQKNDGSQGPGPASSTSSLPTAC